MCDHHDGPALDRRALLLSGAGVATYSATAGLSPAAAARRRRTRQPAVLSFNGHFDGVATPDWHYLPVRVPRGVREIHVVYSYDKQDTGAGFSVNVIDIGMFDPSGHGLGNAAGFRGWSGGARTEFRIASGSATPGYLPGPVTPGVWHVVLGPVAIVPPGVDWRVTVTLTFGPPEPAFKPRPAPRAVAGTTSGWYRGDLHLHTVHSDGRWTQPELLAAARAAGLDFIGSSEHNTSSASLSWGEHVPDDFLVINGEEVTTRAGHWQAMGLPAGAWIDWRFRPADDQLGRFTERVRSLGGLAIANHPWVPIPSTKWDFGYAYPHMDAVEIWNGPWTPDDQTGVEHWHALLVSGRFVPVVGNSDSHHAGQTVGRAQTVVRAASLSSGAVVAGLMGGHAWLAESSAVDLEFSAAVDGRTAECGDRLGAGPTDVASVRLVVSGAPNCLLQVHGPAAVLGGTLTDSAGRGVVEVAVPVATAAFVRAEVRRPGAAPVVNPLEGVPAAPMVAMTNPIFLT